MRKQGRLLIVLFVGDGPGKTGRTREVIAVKYAEKSPEFLSLTIV